MWFHACDNLWQLNCVRIMMLWEYQHHDFKYLKKKHFQYKLYLFGRVCPGILCLVASQGKLKYVLVPTKSAAYSYLNISCQYSVQLTYTNINIYWNKGRCNISLVFYDNMWERISFFSCFLNNLQAKTSALYFKLCTSTRTNIYECNALKQGQANAPSARNTDSLFRCLRHLTKKIFSRDLACEMLS